jgi:transposase-like protein
VVKLKIEFHVPEINTDEWEIHFPCPYCKLETPVTLGQVRHEEYFICRGCHRTIKAIDQLGDTQRLRDDMRNIFKGLLDG